ncbi:hypothetical protein Mal64_25080 [Pseudobythopirellula maris]|uniref:YdjC-like protein n=1 Tax=Pseudobythopirellula maris TaxID=2527991 RepID=A0A5C5ZQ13_9BACT|nr:polysaccharide deacetylase family protein [Pseudobythopirellula maris]TWT89017.1 hypothetical protein Mal64_25080 [Pseudobythopirellula maris]
MKKFLATPAMGLAALSLLLLAPAAASAGEDWARLLGYPEGKRVVILHAHDMGLCYESNAAVAQLIDGQTPDKDKPSQGDPTPISASVMPPAPWFSHAAELAAARPGVDIGLQLTLNSEWPQYRWRPLSGEALASSLYDGDGCMWRSVRQVAINADRDDVEREIRWQLLSAERKGMKPTHLTTHLGALYARPDLAELYLDLARRHWIPAVVVDLTPELAERFAAQGFPVPDRLLAALEEYPLPKLKDLRIVPAADSYDEKVEATIALIGELPAGLSQVAFAPAIDSPALRAITPSWRQFVWDRDLWQDERVKQAMEDSGVVVTTWVEVMERFDGASR